LAEITGTAVVEGAELNTDGWTNVVGVVVTRVDKGLLGFVIK